MKIINEKYEKDGTVTLDLDLTEEEMQTLDELAKSLKLSREQAFVRAIENYVKKHEGELGEESF